MSYDPLTATNEELFIEGGRRIAERRQQVRQANLELVAEINRLVDENIRLEAENRKLKGGDANGDGDSDAVDPLGLRGGRRRSVLVCEGRVPNDPMNSPLNPEINPPPYAALR